MWTNIGKITCDGIECDAVVTDTRWDKTKSDWFFAKDGHSFCSKHIPSWVKVWQDKEKKS